MVKQRKQLLPKEIPGTIGIPLLFLVTWGPLYSAVFYLHAGHPGTSFNFAAFKWASPLIPLAFIYYIYTDGDGRITPTTLLIAVAIDALFIGILALCMAFE